MDRSGTPFAGAKILLVEDDPQAVGILEPILISRGFSVAVARDGVEGLEKVRLLNPYIMLLDITMPRMNGIEVCRQIKSDDAIRLIPIIMLTAITDFEKKMEAVEAGADDFVNKPYNTIELVTRIKSLLKVKYLNEQLDTAEAVLFAMARAIEAMTGLGAAGRKTLGCAARRRMQRRFPVGALIEKTEAALRRLLP